MQSVDVIASGYEWECPECENLNDEIEITSTVECPTCGNKYETNPAEHAIGK